MLGRSSIGSLKNLQECFKFHLFPSLLSHHLQGNTLRSGKAEQVSWRLQARQVCLREASRSQATPPLPGSDRPRICDDSFEAVSRQRGDPLVQ